jgi:hypothetical protein
VAGQVAGGFMNIGRQARGMSRDVSLAEKQMRAFGTTVRYAFAGSVIFGMTSMVGKLNEIQQQMGLIAAIAGPSGVNLTGGGLARLQDELAAKSVDARTNITDLNNSVINYLSTVQGADPKQLPEIVSAIGIAARLSQTPTEDLTKAVTTLNIAAGRNNNIKTINALLREWFSLISQAPGGIAAAPQIAQQLGPLASVAQMGRLTPEQLFGFSLGALRFGATPSVALRGTQYFLQSLFHPPSKQAREAMKGAGFTPELLHEVGGTEFARRYLKYVASLGARPTRAGVKRFGALADVMPNTEAVAGDEFAPNLNIKGLPPDAIAFLSTTLGRIHGIRTALVLLQQLEKKGDVKSLDQLFKDFDKLKLGIGPDARLLQKAADDYRRETPLQAAAIALDSLRLTLARDMDFAINPISRGISGAAQKLTTDAGLRHKVLIGGVIAGGLLATRSLLGKGLLGRGFAGAAVAESLASDTINPPAGTAADPLFVVVLGQLFGGGGGGGGITDKIPPIITGGGKFARARGFLGRHAGKVGLAMTAAWLASDEVGTWFGLPRKQLDFGAGKGRISNMLGLDNEVDPATAARRMHFFSTTAPTIPFTNKTKAAHMFPLLTWLMRLPDDHPFKDRFRGIAKSALTGGNLGQLEHQLGRQLRDKHPFDTPAIKDAMSKMNLPGTGITSTMNDQGEIQLHITITDPKGKTTKLRPRKVPVQFRNGRMPHSRGRRKSMRMEDVLPSWILPDERGQGGR